MKKGYAISIEEATKIRKKVEAITEKSAYRLPKTVDLLADGRSPHEVAQITKYNEKHVRQPEN